MPYNTHNTNSNNHGITNTLRDTLFDIHTVHIVFVGTVINEIIY